MRGAHRVFRRMPRLRRVFTGPAVRLRGGVGIMSEMFPGRVEGFLGMTYECREVSLVRSVFATCSECYSRRGRILGTILAYVRPPARRRGGKVRTFLYGGCNTGDTGVRIHRSGTLLKKFVLQINDSRCS